MEREFRSRNFDRPRYGGGDRDSGGYEKPVKEGETYDLEITELAAKGDGIGRKEGFVVFVPDTKKGDKVSVRITRVLRKFAIGEVVGAASEAPAEAPAEAEEAPAEEPAEAPAEAEEAPAEEEPKEEAEEKPKEAKKADKEDIVEFEE